MPDSTLTATVSAAATAVAVLLLSRLRQRVAACAATAAEEPASLPDLPDHVLHTLCSFLGEDQASQPVLRPLLAQDVCSLRASCRLIKASLTGEDADLGIWKPAVQAVTRAPPQTTTVSYEELFGFLQRHGDLLGEYCWSGTTWRQQVIGGLVRVELDGPERLRATLTTRNRVGVPSGPTGSSGGAMRCATAPRSYSR